MTVRLVFCYCWFFFSFLLVWVISMKWFSAVGVTFFVIFLRMLAQICGVFTFVVALKAVDFDLCLKLYGVKLILLLNFVIVRSDVSSSSVYA